MSTQGVQGQGVKGASRSVQPVTERVSRREDVFSPCALPGREQQSELEQGVVEHTEALVVHTLQLLLRNCPPELLADAAREDLLALEPHLQRALEMLEDIKRHRSLTDKAFSQQHAFKMLLISGR